MFFICFFFSFHFLYLFDSFLIFIFMFFLEGGRRVFWQYVSVQAQQCSSSEAVQQTRDGAFVPDAILPGNQRAPPGQREGRRWPVKIRQQIHGKCGGGAGCQEQVVNVTERLVAGVERGTKGDVQR